MTSTPSDAVTSRRKGRKFIGAATALALAVSVAAIGASQWTPASAQRADAPVAAGPLSGAPATFADIVQKVKPAVVSISVTNRGGAVAQKGRPPGMPGAPGAPEGAIPGLPDLPDDHPLNEFFKRFRSPDQERQAPTFGQGSGFVITPDGYVVTNNHVIDGASKIEVSFDDQEKLDAELVGADPRTDIALLKIKGGKTYPHVGFANKRSRVGDWVLAVGNPFGLGGTVTAGILSAEARDIGSGPYDYIQVDAAVNRGNSGGPTFNLAGEVIGVNTAIYSPSGGSVGIAFAVPADTATNVIEQLRKTGSVSRGWLGVKIQDVEADIAASVGLPEAKGALVTEVTPSGPAANSGLKTRDAIIEVNGTKIENSRDLARKIADIDPDTTVDVKVWRGGSEEMVKVKLGLFPGSQEELAKVEGGKQTPPAASATELDQLGLSLLPGKSEDGVAIAEVDPASDAAQKGLKSGDTIVNINDKTVTTADDVVNEVKKAADLGRKAVLLSIKSGEQTRFVGVQLKKG